METRVLTLDISKLSGKPLFRGPDGSALHDHFEDLSVFDNTLSVNCDTSETGIIQQSSGSPYVNNMTGNTSPSPFIASASGYDTWSGGGQAFKAFDGSSSTGWNVNSSTGWLCIDFGSVKNIASFSVTVRPVESVTYNGFPTAFTFEGWNGSGWDVISTHTETWVNGETKTFSVSASYQKVRLNITGASTSNITIMSFKCFGPSDMTIISKEITALGTPTSASLVILAKDTGVLNTDFKAYVTGNGTYSQVTLVKNYTNEDGMDVLTGSASISGAALRYKIEGVGIVDGVAMWCE